MKIGFVIIIADMKDLQRAHRYKEVREMALQAEALGFDSIWLYDHLLYRPEQVPDTIGIWECWTILSALAEATERVELGTLVICNSFRNPAILAKMAHTIDDVSGGRLILGIGAGWNKPEYDAFGIPFDHRVDRFEEALQIIKPLLKQGRVDFEGKYYQALDCEIKPKSPRVNGPPLMVGSFEPRMMRLTAKYADMWNTAYLHKPESLEEPLSKLRLACQEEGRNLSTLEITAAVGLGYPDLGEPPSFLDEYLSGTDEEIALAMKGYEDSGVSHLMFHCAPYNLESLDRLARSLKIYREM
jgi:probable F420-dependent oxidoreductase